MLQTGRVATRIPARDLARARAFYRDKLGLEPAQERPGGLLYRCASGEFALFASAGASTGAVTQMAWEVDHIDATVTEFTQTRGCLRRRRPARLDNRGRDRRGRRQLPEQGHRRAGCVVSRQRRQHARHRSTDPLIGPALLSARDAGFVHGFDSGGDVLVPRRPRVRVAPLGRSQCIRRDTGNLRAAVTVGEIEAVAVRQ